MCVEAPLENSWWMRSPWPLKKSDSTTHSGITAAAVSADAHPIETRPAVRSPSPRRRHSQPAASASSAATIHPAAPTPSVWISPPAATASGISARQPGGRSRSSSAPRAAPSASRKAAVSSLMPPHRLYPYSSEACAPRNANSAFSRGEAISGPISAYRHRATADAQHARYGWNTHATSIPVSACPIPGSMNEPSG